MAQLLTFGRVRQPNSKLQHTGTRSAAAWPPRCIRLLFRSDIIKDFIFWKTASLLICQGVSVISRVLWTSLSAFIKMPCRTVFGHCTVSMLAHSCARCLHPNWSRNASLVVWHFQLYINFTLSSPSDIFVIFQRPPNPTNKPSTLTSSPTSLTTFILRLHCHTLCSPAKMEYIGTSPQMTCKLEYFPFLKEVTVHRDMATRFVPTSEHFKLTNYHAP